MDIVGGGKVHVYDPVDEGHHKSGPQEMWQESVVLLWWDLKQRIGGLYRIGHETNQKGGPMIATWSTTWSPEGIYKKSIWVPLRDKDQVGNRYGGGDDTVHYDYDGNCLWVIEDKDISMDLRFHDFHPSIDCYPKTGKLAEFAPHHMEVAGTVRGKLEMKGKSYNVDALAFRDHGWGERLWNTLLSHRWVVGVFGKEFSFCAISWHSTDDVLIQFGWVVKGDKVIYAKSVDIVSYVECDAMTTRGGHVKMELTTGEVLDMELKGLAPSTVSFHHDVACVDTMCEVTCDGKVGIADFETTHNGQYGQRRPQKFSNGFIENGWHK